MYVYATCEYIYSPITPVLLFSGVFTTLNLHGIVLI